MTKRSTAVPLVFLFIVAILVIAYATPFGRRAARQAMRATRLARNASGVFSLPVLTVRIWGGSGEPVFRVEVYESGRLVVSGRDRAEVPLPRETAEKLIEIAGTARGDFNSQGCNTATEGMNADLYLMIDGEWTGSVCRNASNWPRGPETRRLLEEISRQLPTGVTLPVGF